jgi:hypothetical protein
MDKERLNELREWSRSKYEEGYTPQEVKDALVRKGFSENDAERVISKGKAIKKLMYNLLMVIGVLFFLAVLLRLITNIGNVKDGSLNTNNRVNINTLHSLALSDFEGISLENFTKSKSSNMLIFTFFDGEHLPVIMTLQIANNNNPSNFSSYFYTTNQEIYSNFSIISTWSEEDFDAVDFSYSFEGTEFVILQRVITVNKDIVALILKCEKENIDDFKDLFDKKVSEAVKIKKALIS